MDVTERLRLHVDYSAKRDPAARQALALIQARKTAAGHELAAQAESWDAKVKALEPSG